MEGICEGYQEIEYYHICSITDESEWKQHKSVYRNTIRRQSNRNIADSAAVIGHIAFPFCYNEFTNLTEERKGDECMRKLMSKKHKPMQIMLPTKNGHKHNIQQIYDDAGKQSDIGSWFIPNQSRTIATHYHNVLPEGLHRYEEKQQSQQCI